MLNIKSFGYSTSFHMQKEKKRKKETHLNINNSFKNIRMFSPLNRFFFNQKFIIVEIPLWFYVRIITKLCHIGKVKILIKYWNLQIHFNNRSNNLCFSQLNGTKKKQSIFPQNRCWIIEKPQLKNEIKISFFFILQV